MMMQMLLGNISITVSLAVAPTSRTLSAPSSSQTFASCTVTATVTGGSVTSYTWSCDNQTDGTWTVNSGQGTATAAARVTGVSGGNVALCDFTCNVLVAGVNYPITVPHSFTNA